MKVLIVDNYDSFTYNLYHLAGAFGGVEPLVLPNDSEWDVVRGLHFDAVILSAGPGRPDRSADVGIAPRFLSEFSVPILGVCLGHQVICCAEGGWVDRAPEPVHGRASAVFHHGAGLFEGIPEGFSAVRYHSLICREPLPASLRKTAWTAEGLVMAVEHRRRPVWGVQFHPESICTEHGARLMENFLRMARCSG